MDKDRKWAILLKKLTHIFGPDLIKNSNITQESWDCGLSIRMIVAGLTNTEERAVTLRLVGFKDEQFDAIFKLIDGVTTDTLNRWSEVLEYDEMEFIRRIIRPKDPSALQKAFEAAFQGENEMPGQILKRLDNYLCQCADKWQADNALGVYAPIGVISQSSGYGKTRMLYQLSLQRVLTYICLREERENGYPRGSHLALYFNLITSEDYAKRFLYFLIETALNDVKSIRDQLKSQNKPVTQENVAELYRNKQPWNVYTETPTVKIKRQISDEEIDQLRDDLVKTMRDDDGTPWPLFIAIDEAHKLFESENKIVHVEKSEFRHIRTALYQHFQNFRISFIFASTNCSIANYQLSPGQYSSSQRSAGRKSYIPFTWFVPTDCLASDYINQLEQVYANFFTQKSQPSKSHRSDKITLTTAINVNSDPHLHEWLRELEPHKSFFRLGRPLWASYVDTQIEGVMVMTEKARIKLLHPDSFRNGQLSGDAFSSYHFMCNTLAVLGSRLDFLVHHINPSYETSCQLVDKCLATLIDMDRNLGQISIRYVSEPILACAAAFYMSQSSYLQKLLANLIEYLERTSGILSAREMGELAAQIIILIAKDKAASIKYPQDNPVTRHAKPLTVNEFLKTLLDGKYDENVVPVLLREGLVSFSHFCKKIDNLSVKDLVCDFIGRNAAGMFKDNIPGVDAVLVVALKQWPWIGLIVIQIKSRIDFLTGETLNLIVKKTNPTDLSKSLKTDIFNETNTFCIIMDLVNPSTKLANQVDNEIIISEENSRNRHLPVVEDLSYTTKQNKKHACIILRGCGTDVYPCLKFDEEDPRTPSVSKLIEKLVDMTRDPLQKYSRFIQKAAFNGSVSTDARYKVDITTDVNLEQLTGTAKNAR